MLRTKTKDPQVAPMLADLLTQANGIVGEEPPAGPPFKMDTRTMGDRLPVISFAYLMTGDKKYLDAAKKWIGAIVGYPYFDQDYDLAGGHLCFGMALAYDWLYDELSSEERGLLEKKMLRHGRILLKISDPMRTGQGWPWGWAYFQNHFFINYTGISAVAMALHDVHPSEMQGWLDHARSLFQVTHDHFATDGYYPEGAAYADYGTAWLLYYCDALRSVSKENLFDMPYLKNAGEYFCEHLMPNWKDVANFSDCPPQMFLHYSSATLVKLASEYQDGRLLTVLDRVEEKHPAFYRNKYGDPFCIIWADPTLKAAPVDDLPLAKIYPDAGVAFFRTSWQEDAAVVAFRCGPPAGTHVAINWKTFKNANPSSGHNHPDANSFVFWAERQWQIGLPGEYTNQKDAHNENTWMVGGKGQRGGGEWFEDGASYMGRTSQPHLVRAVDTAAVSYIVGEAAPAYADDSELKSYERRILFVKNPHPYVVVYDRLEAGKPQTWAAYFHAYESFLRPQAGNPKYFQIANSTRTNVNLNAPGKFVATNQVLSVISHSDHQPEQRGFELVVTPEGGTPSTGLITVLTTTSVYPKFHGDFQAPEIQVGQDHIQWTESGSVVFNGKLIEGNILNPSEPK
ncbi:MAG: heparinase II/III family protein [Chthoniobacteraceae bacterium]